MKTRFCLHTVLVGSYYWITPAEAHPLLIQGEKVQSKMAKTLYKLKEKEQDNRSIAKGSISNTLNPNHIIQLILVEMEARNII